MNKHKGRHICPIVRVSVAPIASLDFSNSLGLFGGSNAGNEPVSHATQLVL